MLFYIDSGDSVYAVFVYAVFMFMYTRVTETQRENDLNSGVSRSLKNKRLYSTDLLLSQSL